MKYIRTYEELNRPYRVGDTIIYTYYDYTMEKEEERIGTIFDIVPTSYQIENKYPKNNKKVDGAYEFQILRLATSEDYEEFELKNSAETYNL